MPGGPTALELARGLIARRSVTPEDGGCQALLAERLGKSGFRSEPMKFGEVANLWARRGSQHPVVCFAGHTDVVPTGPLSEWHSDPFVPTIRDGKLYGRGAADMKSSIAAFVVAAEMFVREKPNHSGSIALLITSDEEGPAIDGTVRVVEKLKARNELMDYCIDWTLGAKPFLSQRGRLAQTVLDAAKRHTGSSGELSTTGGTSDARFIIDICPEVIEIGPINASIHKLNEHIALDELEVLPRIYLDALRTLLP